MAISKLDILSDGPKNIIFGNNSNKTNIGGCLTIVLFIAVLIIFAYYLIIFNTEPNYSIQYVRYEKYLTPDEKKEMENDIRYNPYLIFYFDLKDLIGTSLPEDYVLLNGTDYQLIPRREYINKRVSDIFNIKILYKCNDTQNISECIVPTWFADLYIKYTLFNLEHQNSTSPLYIMKDKFLFYSLRFLADETTFYKETWENVKYNPEAGLTKLVKNLKGIDIEQQKTIGIKKTHSDSSKPLVDPIYIFNETKYRLMGQLEFEVDFNHYDEYTRTKKSFLVLLSDVYSLSLGVFKTLSLFLAMFYSNNFDNYKIFEKIIYDLKPVKRDRISKIEIIKSSINDSLLDKKERNSDLNDDDKENKSLGKENIIHDINESKKETMEKMILPNFRFIDFLFNNCYFNKICKNNKQEIINNCNKLINKYYSIETILYNQIKIEQLLQDYKWNNQELANIKNNEIIIDINNIISPYNLKEGV